MIHVKIPCKVVFVIERLTRRERQVLQLIAAGRTTRELALDLGIAFKTAACHRQRVLDKCGVANTAELVSRAVQKGWVDSGAAVYSKAVADRVQRSLERRLEYHSLLQNELQTLRSRRAQCSAACMALRQAQADFRNCVKQLLAPAKRSIEHKKEKSAPGGT